MLTWRRLLFVQLTGTNLSWADLEAFCSCFEIFSIPTTYSTCDIGFSNLVDFGIKVYLVKNSFIHQRPLMVAHQDSEITLRGSKGNMVHRLIRDGLTTAAWGCDHLRKDAFYKVRLVVLVEAVYVEHCEGSWRTRIAAGSRKIEDSPVVKFLKSQC